MVFGLRWFNYYGPKTSTLKGPRTLGCSESKGGSKPADPKIRDFSQVNIRISPTKGRG